MAVEDEVVSMKFDNRTFEAGVKTTLSTIDKLKQSLKFEGADQGLTNVQRAIGGFKLGTVQSSIQGVSKSFLALSTIGVTALSKLTSAAIDAGKRIAGGLLSPIKAGFANYETQINAVQTILANTKVAGTNLKDVTKALNELNNYANKTIYNFANMAQNIGTFTAAGVDLQTSVNSIKGIANLAALSGSSAEKASGAMYQLSQAIAAGKVNAQDWNSVVNAGMAGPTLQRALANTAVAMGFLDKSAVKLTGKMKNVTVAGEGFKASISSKPGQESWLNSKVLTATLSQFSGDLTDAKLKAQGFNDAQIKAIQATAKTAENAATQIKTVSQLTQALKEEVASSWASVWKQVFGNINQAKSLLSPLHTTIENLLRAPINGIAKLLKGFNALGGRNLAIKGIVQAFHDVVSVMDAVKKGFRDVFPKQTPKGLIQIVKAFVELANKLKPSKQTLDNIRRTFAGVAAVLDIVWQVLKGVAGGFVTFFHAIGGGKGSFLGFTGSLGDILVAFDEFLKKGDYIAKFFNGLATILAQPIKLILALAGAIASIFDGFDATTAKAFSDGFGRVSDRIDSVQSGLQSFSDILHKVLGFIQPFVDAVVNGFGKLGDAIANSLSSGNFNAVFDVINAVLLGGIALLIKKFFDHGLKFDFGQGGLIKSIKDTFGALGDTLGALQAQLKSKTLLNIALAVATLTASMVALSLIDSKALSKALVAISVGFAQLVAAMAILSKMSLVGGKVIALATAMQIMAGAIFTLSLAVAVMGNLKTETIIKGLVGIGGALAVIALAMKLMPKGMLLQAAAIGVLGLALTAIGGAIALLGQLSWTAIAKGLLAIAGAITIIGLAISFIPPSALISAAAIAIVAKGILIIGAAVALLGQLGWEAIAKGLTALAGALLIIGVAMAAMSGALPGAAALIVVAAALAVLAPVLVTLGAMSWMSIVKGMVALAAAFTIIGLAGLVLGPIIPLLLGLGASLLLIGVGLAAAGAGAFLFATAFSIFVAALTAGIAIIGALTTAIPAFMQIFAGAIVAFAKGLVDNADELVKAIVALGSTILKGLTKLIPQVGKLITTLIQTLIHVIRKNAPDLFATGLWLMLQFLKALNRNVPKIVNVATALIVNFLDALGKKMPKIVDAGFKLIIKFLDGITKAINNNSEELGRAGADMGLAIVKGMANAIKGAAHEVVDSVKNMAGGAIKAGLNKLGINSPSKEFAKQGAGIVEGMVLGIDKNAHHVNRSVEKMGQNSLESIKNAMKNAADAAGTEINTRPKITPVLDLSEVRKGAGEIAKHLDKHTIRADVSRRSARDISSTQAHQAHAAVSHEGDTYTFEQNNYSPKHISPVETYRGTSSQIALFRRVTGK